MKATATAIAQIAAFMDLTARTMEENEVTRRIVEYQAKDLKRRLLERGLLVRGTK